MDELKVVTFNVLAPPWAKPSSYPAASEPYLDRVYRRGKIVEFLQNFSLTTDVFALQETTPVEFSYFAEALPDFTGFQSNHDPDYWSKYITEDPPWEPNGTAIFLRKATFQEIRFFDLANSNSGNHAAYAEALHLNSGKKLGLVSVHFDSDTGGNRNKEANAVIDFLSTRSLEAEIIAGDFNFVTERGNFSVDFQREGYINLLSSLEIQGKSQPKNYPRTHPDDGGYANSPNFQYIDHIVIKGAEPLDGDVIDFNLWDLYPPENKENTEARITENLRLVGSDHFPVWGILKLQ